MNDEELLRYSRHIFLPQLDVEGQLVFKNSHVLVVGAGGLGSAALPYLVGSGVGAMTLVDDDEVELSNLPRQVIHQLKNRAQQSAIGWDYALALNPNVVVHALQACR